MNPQSFVNPVLVALATAIEEDDNLGNLLAGDRVYSGLAPQGSPFNYVTLVNATESDAALFGLASTNTAITLDIWTQGPGLMGVTAIFGALWSVLHNKQLPLGSGRMMRGALRLVLGNLGDPNDPSVVRAIAEYQVRACE